MAISLRNDLQLVRFAAMMRDYVKFPIILREGWRKYWIRQREDESLDWHGGYSKDMILCFLRI